MPLTAEQHLRMDIEREILAHGKTWCTWICKSFLPNAYRDARLRYGPDEVQRDYDMCHIWR
jgi:hypothetical protein